MFENNTKRRPDQERDNDLTATEQTGRYREPVNRPAQVTTKKNVVTRIWANPTLWGDVVWKVDQIRYSHHDGQRQTSRSFHEDQISDAIRGLYDAKIWIKRANRRLRLRRWLGWLW